MLCVATSGCGRHDSVESAELVLAEESSYPCEMEIVSTGVRLMGDGRTVPDPNRLNVRDSRGIFYTETFGRDQVVVWSPGGEYVRMIGRSGDGPGEFQAITALFVGPGDSLHVRDLRGWSIFDSAGAFQRRNQNRTLGFRPGHMRFVGAAEVLVSASLGSAESNYFHVVSPTGIRIRSFGPIPQYDLASARAVKYERQTAWAGGSTFWAGAVQGSSDGYELEEWSIDGERLRAIKRNAPWFPVTHDQAEIRPAPRIAFVHSDSAGRVLVYSSIATNRFRTDAPPGADMSGWWDDRYEVIDTKSNRVVASGHLAAGYDWPWFYEGTHDGYWARQDSSGEVYHELIRFRLIPATPRAETVDARACS
jgi:hypothetical protein